ncbi:MAG: RagB/SusD family nutrient uptake outer membrane protein [Odoribacteraceae bacterium]|jgi:hypothetical protein|nr:RagB/SusD family nutrient uptake outer membrane protein [Odoribacteraceae bacterium]
MKHHATPLLVAIVLLLTGVSCEGWLHVQPTSKIEAEKFLQEESGFKAVLTGLYNQLKHGNLFGETLTIGLPEHMVSHWDASEGSENANVNKHYYKDTYTERTLDSIFLGLYRVIAEANLVLQHIDNNQAVFADATRYKIAKGEALGTRAFCHLELLRWWGPIPGTQTGARMLPYPRVISKTPHEYLTYAAYTALLLEDLDEAQRLLKEADPIYTGNKTGDSFYDLNRQSRVNYYAVTAMKARFHLWNGDKPAAAAAAREVIDATGKFSLANKSDFASPSTYILPTEHIFELELYYLADLVPRFRANYLKDQVSIMRIFGLNFADVRYVNWWGDYIEEGQYLYIFKKYIQSHSGKIPLIRLSELYLIAIECGDPGAQDLYNLYCDTRGTLQNPLTVGLQNTLLTEYNREFYGEGQLFFQYKRLSVTDMFFSTPITNLPAAYVMPLPQSEIIL